MLRRLSSTPCPPGGDTRWGSRDSLSDQTTDLTADLEYTTNFKASFQQTKPRRPTRPKQNPLTIHEDEELKIVGRADDHVSLNDTLPGNGSSVANGTFAGARRRVSFSLSGLEEEPRAKPPSNLSRAPRRSSIRPDNQVAPVATISEQPTKISKPARRGTIFIPSDYTTMPTMFMDIFSPLKNAGPISDGKAPQDSDLTGLALQMARKRGRRSSILANSPKRAPLLDRTGPPVQPNILSSDRPGKGPGKENVPPSYVVKPTKKPKSAFADTQRHSSSTAERTIRSSAPSSRLFEPTASTAARISQTKVKPVATKTAWNSNFLLPKPKPELIPRTEEAQQPGSYTSEEPIISRPHVPSRFVVPTIRPTQQEEYVFIPEGVVDASMYESNWLGQQEIAITQLINNLFSTASLGNSIRPITGDLDRLRLVEIYGSTDMSLLYKRLQGCLAHGSLSLAGEGVIRGQRLSGDLAKRKAYTQFWLKTYDHKILRMGLEVIVGRIVPLRTSGNISESQEALAERAGPIQRFIEKFLIRNEDRRSTDTEDELYQRTVLRSLMLIKVLDMTKTHPTVRISSNLFHKDSSWKSSHEASLQMLTMLNPNAGDAGRALRNVGFVVSHEQYPLEEFRYTIDSLATDMRDGIRLTRMVELLLYQGASQSLNYDQDLNATTTVTIPSGATLCLGDSEQMWPISQHLRVPADGRTAKLYNVELALSALKEVKGMRGCLQDLTASDIVDGSQEKTVHLLWVLCSKYGLAGLLDWNDIKSEIKRFGRLRGKIGNTYLASFDVEDDVDEGHVHFKSLLRTWVKALAMSHGHRVRNFTTDFVDGRIFNAIVAEYQSKIPGIVMPPRAGDLRQRLKQLGCSNEFANLFAASSQGPSHQQIFDRDFVLASIAFLASRLLQPTKATRAAIVLQRAWRQRFTKVLTQRKLVLRTLAEACAEYKRAIDAKTLIWRVWKLHRARKRVRSLNSPGSARGEDIWLSL